MKIGKSELLALDYGSQIQARRKLAETAKPAPDLRKAVRNNYAKS